jgi:hypothetical protein
MNLASIEMRPIFMGRHVQNSRVCFQDWRCIYFTHIARVKDKCDADEIKARDETIAQWRKYKAVIEKVSLFTTRHWTFSTVYERRGTAQQQQM